MAENSHGAARSLADQLRAWPDERLAQLLRQRPDLATPAPHDCAQLAARAATRPSLLRAIDRLDQLELTVLDALVVGRETTRDRLVTLVNATPEAADRALERLVDLAVVWESGGGLRPLSPVADVLQNAVSGLQPLTVGTSPDPDLVSAQLATISAKARTILDHLDESGAEGTAESARSDVTPEEARTPVEELLAHGLLTSRERGRYVVPGEVGIALRGGTTTREPVDVPPEIATTTRTDLLVTRTAAGAAFEAVRRVELLLDQWGSEPPVALRSGGLGVRDLRAAAAHLQLDDAATALLTETAAAAGLLAVGADGAGGAAWMPTDAFDLWSGLPVEERWVRLARAWLANPRLSALVGSRDAADKPINALVPDLARSWLVETRRSSLDEIATLAPGEVLASGTGVPSLVARLAWLRPRRPLQRTDAVGWTVAEAALLGVLGLGGLSDHGRALLARDGEPAAALAPLLPEPVDHVLLQADLTAVAPGPLETELARKLQLLADVESRGGATVYRFTQGSVRRAFDAGWSAQEVHDFVGSISRTPVPQPLTYLVDDTSRTFGTLRVGSAEAFLRADDEAVLTELLHHPKAGTLGLRRIAPTVLVSTTALDVLLPRLRDLGAAPVVEAADGTVRVVRRDLRRARTPRSGHSAELADTRQTAHVTSVVRAVRAGDLATSVRTGAPPQPTPATPGSALTALRESVETREAVLIGYVDNHGTSTERVVDPVKVEGGWLTAYDHRSEDIKMFAVHRITAVRAVDRRP